MIQDRDCGDETDKLHARLALKATPPMCPKCGCYLEPPFRPWNRDTKWHTVTCRTPACGQPVIAKWFEEQT